MTFQLFNADCLQKMKDISDNSIDLIICDLPFGCLTGGGGEEKRKRKEKLQRADNPDKPNNRKQGGVIAGCAWDVKIDLDAFWKEVKRIRKDDHSPCIHFCNTKFGYDLIKSNEKEFRQDLVWNKMRGVSFLSSNQRPMHSHEMIYIFSKKGAKYNRIDIAGEPYTHKKSNSKTKVYNTENTLTENTGSRCVLSVINESSFAKKDQHPTEKPKALYEWLISRYSNPGDMILDPTFGSCNSGEVSRELGRNYIGIEMNEEYYQKAVERLIT
jgi:site-specific DNA-methyltransferase (adenine-specific)